MREARGARRRGARLPAKKKSITIQARKGRLFRLRPARTAEKSGNGRWRKAPQFGAPGSAPNCVKGKLLDPRLGPPAEEQPDAEEADEEDHPRRGLRHVVGRRRRRAFRIRLRIAGRRRRDDRRDDNARNVERRNKGRQPFGDRRRVGRGRLRRRRRQGFWNPPWLPWRRIITGKPFGNGAGP